ncbi:MAG: alanine racemase, partial [Planctomycetes bacterium]|nr:alanine racemase [Planctomycetota bacterium]
MPITELHHPSHHRSWIEIDLSSIEDNVASFRELAGKNCAVMPCIKADAYGHGAVAVAFATISAGAERLVVATCQEGEELRCAGITVPVHILGASLPEEVPNAIANNLTLSIHEIELARLVSLEAVKHGQVAPLHLKIDTGMGRLGILPEDAAAEAA